MQDIVIVAPVDVEAELDSLAQRYRAAGGIGIQVLNAVGGKAESLLDKLPQQVRGGLTEATERALSLAMRAAQGSRRALPKQTERGNMVWTTAMGAAGGLGGLSTALVELPVTTTVLLRAIQDVAASYGFDPASENVQFDCIRVFSAAGPLAVDDGADLGFVSLRLTLTGNAMQKMIAAVAPRLAAAMGQKLAVQSVPILGAMAGASVNYVYTRYYQQIAHVHFGLRKLAIDADIPHGELVSRLSDRMALAAR
ncbi:EcsC family protein [Ruegeria sp. WL0004]|uniref:EcsC family protein n=1 Tax=Ruegeria marisflavi TaxID=2984152 RepID=A0ABT2WR25_9RHOB|nr:EcsC family protein [Ruegeria sp. WL0004]MCU9838354.1 EcsC family protein [Ruegeria sp. WL0004]